MLCIINLYYLLMLLLTIINDKIKIKINIIYIISCNIYKRHIGYIPDIIYYYTIYYNISIII
ncbi:hypothetical protein GCM10009504_47490 [Pseudomonas laurentiana]|nr:hypothetical protein GCM10009504_47490 [Pseudomonas laurentiana]